MKRQHIREACIALIAHTGLAWLYRMFISRRGPLVRVIVFHDVQDKKCFEETLNFLTEQYHILTPEAFFSAKFHPHRINVLITFDDGYESWVSICAPILERINIKGIFFVNSGLLDVAHERDARMRFIREGLLLTRERNILSWDGLQKLYALGHMVGGHSRSHIRLASLEPTAQREQVETDKGRIEEILGTTITTFAYPFGRNHDFTGDTETLVQASGYKIAFSACPGFVANVHSFHIPRVCIEEGISTRALACRIEGSYDIVQALKVS